MCNPKEEMYSKAQKCIFSMKLKKIRDQWKKDTGKSYEEMYAEIFRYSKPSMERALSGNPSECSMKELAACVNMTVEEMTRVDFKSICELISYRLEKKEYKVMMFSLICLLWSALLAIITSEWWSFFMIYASATILFENMEKSIWETKIYYTKEHNMLKKILHVYVVLFMFLGLCVEISARFCG